MKTILERKPTKKNNYNLRLLYNNVPISHIFIYGDGEYIDFTSDLGNNLIVKIELPFEIKSISKYDSEFVKLSNRKDAYSYIVFDEYHIYIHKDLVNYKDLGISLKEDNDNRLYERYDRKHEITLNCACGYYSGTNEEGNMVTTFNNFRNIKLNNIRITCGDIETKTLINEEYVRTEHGIEYNRIDEIVKLFKKNHITMRHDDILNMENLIEFKIK